MAKYGSKWIKITKKALRHQKISPKVQKKNTQKNIFEGNPPSIGGWKTQICLNPMTFSFQSKAIVHQSASIGLNCVTGKPTYIVEQDTPADLAGLSGYISIQGHPQSAAIQGQSSNRDIIQMDHLQLSFRPQSGINP